MAVTDGPDDKGNMFKRPGKVGLLNALCGLVVNYMRRRQLKDCRLNMCVACSCYAVCSDVPLALSSEYRLRLILAGI